MKANSITKPLVWILMGLLIIGLGGFGATNLSGTVRTIGSVGDATIDVTEYSRALRNEIRAIESERGGAVSFAEAREMGVTDSVLARLIATAALDHEAERIGLSIGDANLREEIVGMQQFQAVDGGFDREAYSFALEQAGMSESEFEADVRDETARSFLQSAVMSGVTMPEGYTRPLIDYLGERREVAWAVLDRGDLATGLPVPERADLEAYHAAHEDRFTLPERKRITYARLTPDMLIDTVEVDEQALREAYAAREDEFNRPARRLVERLAFADRAAARAARERLREGETGFEDLVAARGLELADIDLGDVTRDELGEAAEEVFAAGAGEVVGPLPSPVGPALFRVNAVLSAQTTSFEEARAELRETLARDRARRAVEARIEEVEDKLAAGATLEDLSAETEMELGEIAWHDGMREGIAAYQGFREAAAAVSADDYPQLRELRDGGIFALRLDEVVPPELQPLADVRERVEAAWTAETVVDQLTDQVQAPLSELRSGAALADTELRVDGQQTMTRRGFRADVPRDFIETVFGLEAGGATVIRGDGRIFVVKLDRVLPPDPEDQDLQQIRSRLQERAASGLGQDLFQLLANDIRARAGLEIDQSAINAVHANFQ
jgi:peptidyl-prolyl cis-trans isomerase D